MYGASIGAIAFDFCELERSHSQGHSNFEGLHLVKERSYTLITDRNQGKTSKYLGSF